VELDELQVLQRQTSSDNHGVSVTGTGVCGSAREVGSAVTARSQNGLVRPESVERSVLEVERNDTDALSVLHQQVQGEVLDEEVGVVSERLSVEGVKDGVSGSVGSGSTSVSLSALSEIERLSTESTLVDLALFRSREGDTVVLELHVS
jgi:hypothetical protein